MKCTHLYRLRTDELRHSTPHFISRLVGKGQRHDLFCRNAGRDQVRNSVGHDAGFTAAGAC